MKKFILAALAVAAIGFGALPARAAPEIGKPAPAFTATDSNGKTHSLNDFKGKIVVLEWTNPECPFVKKHYDSNNMQELQKTLTGKDVVWLSVNSSAKGKQGHQTAKEANAYMTEKKSEPTARLLDDKGELGKAYDAKTTPHMFVIDKDGVLAYEGAIDDNDSFNAEDAKTAKNYVAEAVTTLQDGKKVLTGQTKPYGCSVKY